MSRNHFPLGTLLVLSTTCATPGVFTQRVNNYRQGAYLDETTLKPSNVHAGSFGRLYERNVDGQVLANPLVVPDVKLLDGTKRTLFYIATAKNCVYAFDLNDTSADGPPEAPPVFCLPQDLHPDLNFRDGAGHCAITKKAIWTREIAVSGCAPVCAETWPMRVGVTSTPVIDAPNGSMYIVSYHVDNRQHFLHKLNIATGADVQPPVQIGGSADGKTFNAACHRNRPGLLLQAGVVYVGFATFSCDGWCGDNDPYRGWVFGYNASNLSPAGVYTTSADGGQAGIWQSGNGLVGDGTHIYFMTGNESLPAKRGDSFIRLDSGGGALSEAGFFQPANHERLRIGDTDLGSSGPIYLPGDKILGGGKEGRLHLLNSSMSGPHQEWLAFVNTYHNNPLSPRCLLGSCSVTHASCAQDTDCPAGNTCTLEWQRDPTGNNCFIPMDHYQDSEHWGPNIHNGPVYWESAADANHGFVYLMPEKDYLKQFRYDLGTHQMETSPFRTSTERPADGMPGGAISISASGGSNGVVWAIVPNANGQSFGPVGGHLVAFNADDLSIVYRDDDPVAFAKFNPPIAAFGKVIRATFANRVIVYGLLPGPCGGGPVNACGGCNTLAKPPGSWCQEGGQCGRWKCIGDSAVTCDTTKGLPNPCGGCSPMALPGTGYGRGDQCFCSNLSQEGILVCSADKNHLLCCPCNSAPGCGPGSP